MVGTYTFAMQNITFRKVQAAEGRKGVVKASLEPRLAGEELVLYF
jgi:hypothetical protein